MNLFLTRYSLIAESARIRQLALALMSSWFFLLDHLELSVVMATSRIPLQSRGNLQGATKKSASSARSRGPSIDRAALLEDLRSISENFASPECQIDVIESDLTNPTVSWW